MDRGLRLLDDELARLPEGGSSQVIASLGYSEPSNFYRAFRGWFGLTPAEYRRRHGQGRQQAQQQGGQPGRGPVTHRHAR